VLSESGAGRLTKSCTAPSTARSRGRCPIFAQNGFSIPDSSGHFQCVMHVLRFLRVCSSLFLTLLLLIRLSLSVSFIIH